MTLKWDGEDDEDDSDEEAPDSKPRGAEQFDEEIQPDDHTEQSAEVTVEEQIAEDPDECQHPWQSVSQETMKRVVNGSTIDTKQIYWCDSCKTILDVL